MLSWFRQIDGARSVSEVLSIARDYIATWTPEELARLPAECRPGRIRDETDLEQLHSVLVEEYRRNRLPTEDLAALQRLTSFMVRSSVRLAQLHHESTPDVPPPPPRRDAAARER